MAIHHPHAHHADPPALHGMVVLGQRSIFLSHLPMFHVPHNYQVLMEVKLLDGRGRPARAYARHRKQTGEALYTLVPAPFVLTELIEGNGGQHRDRFEATIFRGHFERGGEPLSEQPVTVSVVRVVHFRKLEPNAEAPGPLRYLLFGRGRELFAAHLIHRPPDFDQLLEVAIEAGTPSAAALRKGVVVTLEDRRDSPSDRLAVGAPVSATLEARSEQTPIVITLRPTRELYFETGDLEF